MVLPFRRPAEETDRLVALSDGVIAIVITLLVLDITVPTLPAGRPASLLPVLVLEQWPEFLGFVLSFWVIGLYWVLHRRTFVHIERHEHGVVLLNLLFLLMVAFIPYATAVFTSYPDQFGVMFLSGVLALTGLSLALVWMYASRKDLLEEGLTSRATQIATARYLVSPLVFTAAVVVAAVDPVLAMLTWLLLIPLNAALQSRLVESLESSLRESEPEAR